MEGTNRGRSKLDKGRELEGGERSSGGPDVSRDRSSQYRRDNFMPLPLFIFSIVPLVDERVAGQCVCFFGRGRRSGLHGFCLVDRELRKKMFR